MAFTTSRTVSRKAPMKGVKAIGLVLFDPDDLVVNTVTGVLVLPAAFTSITRLEVRATGNNFVETGTFDEATRTTEYVGVNTFFVPGIDISLRNEVQGNDGFLQVVFIEDYNNKVYVAGSQNGADIMTIVGSTDTQGFALTVNSKESTPMFELSEAAITAYRALV